VKILTLIACFIVGYASCGMVRNYVNHLATERVDACYKVVSNKHVTGKRNDELFFKETDECFALKQKTFNDLSLLMIYIDFDKETK
jgi:hypothetical protein